MKLPFTVLLAFGGLQAAAQTTPAADSSIVLKNVIVSAYENNARLIDVPAAVSLVTKSELNRFNNTSVLSALNNNPGVRMEERSPGSYRLAIRGSSLRSPFGVRDVKVYYDGIPYTDPGGNTYLNQLGYYNFQSVEIIKGPGSSLYGAGIGGVLLIRNDAGPFHPGGTVGYEAGSYGLQNINANVRLGNDSFHHIINYHHQSSDGYRDHTAMRRDVLTWDVVSRVNSKSELQAHFLYADLYYQTPGGLTLKEYDSIPRSARPKAGAFPGSDQAKAAIYQKTFLAGFSYVHQYNDSWSNTTNVYAAYTDIRNPTIRNYELRSEPHFGGRTIFQYRRSYVASTFTFHAGAEFQQSFNAQRDYGNRNGVSDTLQTDDQVLNNQGFLFAEANLQWQKGWTLTGGVSINRFGLNFTQRSDVPPTHENRSFNNQLTPRLALLREVRRNISVYGSIARGYSSPTLAELLPSTNVFNTTLQAESDWDYELGVRGSFLRDRLYVDVNAFYYSLKNAIVQLQNAGGADYFDNAGSTRQKGLESFISWDAVRNGTGFLDRVSLHASDTWYGFHYDVYKELGVDYAGHQIPGVANQTFAAGADLHSASGFYLDLNYFYSSRIALNDANSAYAPGYGLLGGRLGYRGGTNRKLQWELYTAADNLLNVKYSLGDDINAAGGRYYNLAPGSNFAAGVMLQFNRR